MSALEGKADIAWGKAGADQVQVIGRDLWLHALALFYSQYLQGGKSRL
jgi:hypothetical protein